jgi:hypothetical protein
MTNTPPFIILNKPCGESVAWAIHRLEQAGFQAVRTFDLQAARVSHLHCACPHHGTSQCNCQMIVHGCDERSWFYLVNSPQQSIAQSLEKPIQDALSLEIDATV